MQSAQTLAPKERTSPARASERRCLATGEVLPKDELIRFAADPDGFIIPDLAQNLPGRGLWVKAARDAIDTAARKNLFSRAAKTPLKAGPDLVDQVERLLHKRCLAFMGLARGAGLAVLGQPQVEAALKAGKLDVLLLASDAGQPPHNSRGIAEYPRFTRDELGAAFGHDQIVYAGLRQHGLTEKLKTELARLEKIAAPHHISEGNG
jgi:predicted RNA-binding protein YlxR (DUF448 family)